jgi:hypothetical protein
VIRGEKRLLMLRVIGVATREERMPKKEISSTDVQPERVLDLKPGEYSDGHPLDEVQ